MDWTLHVTLRPGAPDERSRRFDGATKEEAQAAMYEWVTQHAAAGERVEYAWGRTTTVGAGGNFGEFVVE